MHSTYQLSWFSQESPSFSSNLPVPWLEHQISWGKTYHGLFQKFFVNFLMFEKWKRKLKQEVDLVLLFELFLIAKHKTGQSNWYEYCNWSEINQLYCTIHRRKLARLLHTVINSANIQKAFGWFSESIQTLSKMTFFQFATYTSPTMHCICSPKFCMSVVFNSSWAVSYTHLTLPTNREV